MLNIGSKIYDISQWLSLFPDTEVFKYDIQYIFCRYPTRDFSNVKENFSQTLGSQYNISKLHVFFVVFKVTLAFFKVKTVPGLC